jgi:exosortase
MSSTQTTPAKKPSSSTDEPKAVGRRSTRRKAERPASAPGPKGAEPVVLSPNLQMAKLAVAATCLAAGLIAYGPTIVQLARVWIREPDYSHGFLVVPLAAYFCWLRKGSFPGLAATSPVLSIGLFAGSLALRLVGAKYFFTFMDGWSLVLWVASIVAVLGGRPLLWWCLPSIGFLIFMVPLPFRIEGELSAPLQRIATKLSTTALQTLGQPAFNEGNIILMRDERLVVAEACSGLRLFVSVLALTYAYIAIINRPWWEKLMLALSAIPIAIVSNSARIVATGLLYTVTTSETLRHLAHDWAGFAMIAFAAVLFWLLLKYLKLVIVEEEAMDMASVVRQAKI